jgi:hypothetical protein
LTYSVFPYTMPALSPKTSKRCESSLKQISGRFLAFVADLERIYGCTLSKPSFDSLSSISKFCTGLVERDLNHPWRVEIDRLSAQSRFGLGHSLFLFEK